MSEHRRNFGKWSLWCKRYNGGLPTGRPPRDLTDAVVACAVQGPDGCVQASGRGASSQGSVQGEAERAWTSSTRSLCNHVQECVPATSEASPVRNAGSSNRRKNAYTCLHGQVVDGVFQLLAPDQHKQVEEELLKALLAHVANDPEALVRRMLNALGFERMTAAQQRTQVLHLTRALLDACGGATAAMVMSMISEMSPNERAKLMR